MEIELEAQCFSKVKKLQRATLEFEGYTYTWWKKFPHKHYVKCWEDLKKVMRKEFVPKEYELILLRCLKHVKQGTKSVQAYYDELYSCMYRANVIDDLDAIEYFKKGLNPKIAVAIEGRYARSVRGFLTNAIKEVKKVKKMQERIAKCVDLCQNVLSNVSASSSSSENILARSKEVSSSSQEFENVCADFDGKKAPRQCARKRQAITKCSSVDFSLEGLKFAQHEEGAVVEAETFQQEAIKDQCSTRVPCVSPTQIVQREYVIDDTTFMCSNAQSFHCLAKKTKVALEEVGDIGNIKRSQLGATVQYTQDDGLGEGVTKQGEGSQAMLLWDRESFLALIIMIVCAR
uniref:Retrotransposon gag domain-containing protein n=1 Tax=Oryza glumipatula TaxID=40148 RepID=A0A0E0BSI1_9ORYZ